MNGSGFDWLNMAGLSSDSNLPPPPVSFGVTPTSSSSSVNLVQQNGEQEAAKKAPNLSIRSQSEEVLSKPTYLETEEDLAVPLSLTIEQLTRDEAKTYLRWYNDIVVRKNTKLIRIKDVFNFLNNFNISEQDRSICEKIFRSCSTLNIGEFFALLRLISHTILGSGNPSRKLIKTPAPIPKPRSILSRKRMNDIDNGDDEYEDNNGNDNNDSTKDTASADPNKFDLDSFTQFILTGERPGEEPLRRRKKISAFSKRVKFSDEISVEPSAEAAAPVNLDLTLPMDQLLGRYHKPQPPQPQSEKKVNEDEELNEMPEQFDHFKNVKNVDSALVHGTPANIPSIFFDNEMASNNGSPRVASPDPSSQLRLLSPNHTGPVRPMAPNHTGPVAHSGFLQPTATGGDMFLNSLLSPQTNTSPQPTGQQASSPTPSNGQLSSNYTGFTQGSTSQLQPTMTGSLSSQMRSNFGSQRVGSASPLGNSHLSVPAPPLSRQRSASSPIPFDPNSLHAPSHSAQQRVPSPIGSSKSPPPPPPPRSRASTLTQQAPPPPPSRNSQPGPALPPKIPVDNASSPYYQPQVQQNNPYANSNDSTSSSTADILGDLKALQSEVDRLQYYR